MKHDNKSVFTVIAEPSSVFTGASTPTVQIKRIGIGTTAWMDLLNQTGNIDWYARVAGIFKLRLKTKVDEADFVTPEKDMTVNFPTYVQIIADSTVSSKMASEWQATLDDCTEVPNQRRERGFWIELDTSGSGSYICGSSIQSSWTGPNESASIELGARPGSELSEVAPNASSAIYSVASFHTHTPMSYRPTGDRITGPSRADIKCDISDNVAGIVYDYSSPLISSGHNKNDPAQTYMSRNQRALTAE